MYSYTPNLAIGILVKSDDTQQSVRPLTHQHNIKHPILTVFVSVSALVVYSGSIDLNTVRMTRIKTNSEVACTVCWAGARGGITLDS